jgi:3-methyladenine DNA glycosylase Tag
VSPEPGTRIALHVLLPARDDQEQPSEAVLRTGMSWHDVDAKWIGIREAFHGLDPDTVARPRRS